MAIERQGKTNPIAMPKWIQQRYSVLWSVKRDAPFNHVEAMQILGEKEPILMSVFISELRKAEWLESKLNPKDARKRIYVLKSPEKIFLHMAKIEKQEIHIKKI